MSLVLLGFSTQAIAQLPYPGIFVYPQESEGISDAEAALIESSQPDILKKYSNIKFIRFPSDNGLESEVHQEPYQADGVVMDMDGMQADLNVGHVAGYVVKVEHPKDVLNQYKPNGKIEKVDGCQEFPNPSEALKEYQAKNCPPAEKDPAAADEPDNQVQATSTPVEGTATNTVGSDVTNPSDPSDEATEEITDEFDAAEPDSIISQGGGCAFGPALLSTSFSSFWMLTPLTLIFLRFLRR